MTQDFIVHTNCEFSMVVQAESEADAIEKAPYPVNPEEWEQAWSPYEAEAAQ